MQLLLYRTMYTPSATIGLITTPNTEWATLEPPWRHDAPGLSCIPSGMYVLIPHNSPAHPDTWEIKDVPGRTEILLHPGNSSHDTEGCILVGTYATLFAGTPQLVASDIAYDRLRGHLAGSATHALVIL